MDKETYLKRISNKMAVLGAVGVTVLFGAFLVFVNFTGNGLPIFLIITVLICVCLTTLVMLLLIFTDLRKYAEYWDNMIMYDQKFIPDLKKDYKDRLFKMRINLLEITNYQFNRRMRYMLPMLLFTVILINVFLLYFYLTPSIRYPGFDHFTRTFILIGNAQFLGIPLLLWAIFLLVSPSYRINNFAVLREDDLIVISQINDSLIKNMIPYDAIWDVKKVHRKGSKHGALSRWKLNLRWIYNHPKNGFYVPTLKEKELVRIRFRRSRKLLQYGCLVRRKKIKRFEYIQADSILLEMKDPDGFMKDIERTRSKN